MDGCMRTAPCRTRVIRRMSSLSVSTIAVCAKVICRCGSSARATMTAPATLSSSQCSHPSATSTATSAGDEAGLSFQPKMLSVFSRTDERLSASLLPKLEWPDAHREQPEQQRKGEDDAGLDEDLEQQDARDAHADRKLVPYVLHGRREGAEVAAPALRVPVGDREVVLPVEELHGLGELVGVLVAGLDARFSLAVLRRGRPNAARRSRSMKRLPPGFGSA